jgi:hypothetical protein
MTGRAEWADGTPMPDEHNSNGRATRNGSTNGAARRMVVRRASDIPEGMPPSWVAVRWVPRGLVTVLCGDEGIGKSLWWVLLVAHITTGRPLPECGLPAREPADVIVVITEDSWAEARARLLLARADLQRVHVVTEENSDSGVPIFPPDMGVVDAAAKEVKAALVVVDAWLDTVETKVTIKDPQQARTAIAPWKTLAAQRDCGVILLCHTNRNTGASVRDRVGATGALRQVTRSLLFADTEHADDIGHTLVIGPEKVNGGYKDKAVRFDLRVEQVRQPTDDDPGTCAKLSRPVRLDHDITRMMAAWAETEKDARKASGSADGRIDAWLLPFMAQHKGQVPAKFGQDCARAKGHNVDRVAQRLRAAGGYSKPLQRRGAFYWLLPSVTENEPDEPDLLDSQGLSVSQKS